MSSDSKRLLNTTIRGLRDRLLTDLRGATEAEYRLSLPLAHADLSEARRLKRNRLERWIGEQVRAATGREDVLRARFLGDVVEQAAATLLNRLVFLRLMEAWGLRDEKVLTGGWSSRGYKDFRALAPGLIGDETEGYSLLLSLVFEDLATDLPGLFGDVGLGALIPVPDATLRGVVEALDQEDLEPCWHDDTTPGWIYQYWNDPRREALDSKLNQGGKVEPHEVASKTQMFTERYMVEWLLQNSLGATWMAMCKAQGWTPEAESSGALARLEDRRVDWRAKREAGDVELDALMPVHGEAEERWKYWVDQPIPADAVGHAPRSVRDIKLIDPACGSGHFLVIAFDLLAALYREEARHLGEEDLEQWSDMAIAERIVEHNLHGIDLDPRAVQIAAAALWLKVKALAPDAQPERMNLVASALRLGALPDDDPARVELRRRVQDEVGLPGDLTDGLVHALAGADHIGSLLKVDRAISDSLEAFDKRRSRGEAQQGDLMGGFAPQQRSMDLAKDRASVLQGLEAFLARHGGGEDLGLRLRGEQLAAGLRLIRLLGEGQYDLVVGNPPYQGTSKMADPKYVQTHYKLGKADLYAAFLLRGLELAKEGGTSALLTMRNWMFIKQYAGLREELLGKYDLRMLGDVDRGAFEDVPDEVVSCVISVFRRAEPADALSVALQPTPLDDTTRDSGRTPRKRAAMLAGVGRFEFDVGAFAPIPEKPLVYWWTAAEFQLYGSHPLLGTVAPAKFGQNLGDNARFTRRRWEIASRGCFDVRPNRSSVSAIQSSPWVRYLMGATGIRWFDPVDSVCKWGHNAFEIKVRVEHRYRTISRKITNEDLFFRPGVGFVMIGAEFAGRAHRWRCVVDGKGSSLYPADLPTYLCLLNASKAKRVLASLNPGLDFTVGDVNRLPVFPTPLASAIVGTIDAAFTTHESHREPSVEFLSPGPSPWTYAQNWAQRAVDRPEGDPLPPYEPTPDDIEPPAPTDHVSFGVGVALGRFGAQGEGILDEAPADALPDGILYLSEATEQDSLPHPACRTLRDAWVDHGGRVDTKKDLRAWLRLSFFSDVHRQMYENRPIHFPLSSAKKSFVGFVSIHRFTVQTLRDLLATHLKPEEARLDGELKDLRAAAQSGDRTAARRAEDRLAKVQKWREELTEFIEDVQQCAEKGPLPPDTKTPPREVDARYAMDLDDGVLVNAAGLWPLLTPQWKDPKKWWKQLATSPKNGNKDLDWSHLAARYFPTRVDRKCQTDPSLGVAHGCFWRYHPERAYAWELRLQDEIGPDFTLDEKGSDEARAAFERAEPSKVTALREAERKRREKKRKKEEKQQAELFSAKDS